MRSITGIVDMVLGQPFEIDCINIRIRGRGANVHTEPYFSGPGSISGNADGQFRFRLYDTLQHDSKDLIRLTHVAAAGTEPMAIDATDYDGSDWTGAWFIPQIHVSTATGKWLISGEFPQLSSGVAFTSFDGQPKTTVNYYAGVPRLPMLGKLHTQHIRDGNVELVNTRWDRSALDFGGAAVTIAIDDQKNRTVVSTTYRDEWTPPYCEVGLADAFAFVTATNLRPRITVRGFDTDALVFIRFTPEDPRTGMLRPISEIVSERAAFWNLFLAFLRHCDEKHEFYSTRLSRLFSELVLASTGTLHGFIVSLLLAIEDLVDQLTDSVAKPVGVEELKQHVQNWSGDERLKKRAVGIISSFVSNVSTNEKLHQLVSQQVVTEEQRKLWDELRNKMAVAHGRLINYEDENLMMKRNQLITMFYRLALRLLKYRGPITDYSGPEPAHINFEWLER